MKWLALLADRGDCNEWAVRSQTIWRASMVTPTPDNTEDADDGLSAVRTMRDLEAWLAARSLTLKPLEPDQQTLALQRQLAQKICAVFRIPPRYLGATGAAEEDAR